MGVWKGGSEIGYDGERERGRREKGRESWARDSSLQKMEALLPPAAMAVLRRSPFPRDNILGERAAGEK